MLPRWHRRLKIFLGPQQVSLMEISGGLRRRVVRTQTQRVEGMPTVHAWEASVDTLEAMLNAGAWHGCPAEIVISSRFVRYALIPWSSQLSNRQERLAFLGHCFHLRYGESSRQWDLRMTQPSPDVASLASGINFALLESLKAVMQEAETRTPEIYPALMASANLSRAFLRCGTVWFVAMEQGQVSLALVEAGNWLSISCHPVETHCADDFTAQIETLMARESILLGKLDQCWPVVIHHPSETLKRDGWKRKVTSVRQAALKWVRPEDEGSFHLLAGV